MVSVVLLVVLRASIGCHFLYEGMWKIHHPDKFSTEPFLLMAKGPAAPLFYAMLDDIDGRERLKTGEVEVTDPKDKKKKIKVPGIPGQRFLNQWNALRLDTEQKYGLDDKQKKAAGDAYKDHAKALVKYLALHFEDIEAYFGSLDRFEADKAVGNNGATHQKERVWGRQQELRKEVKEWLTDVEKIGQAYQQRLWSILTDEQREKGSLPVGWTTTDYLDFMLTFSLTAIGVCLLLGLCTRLAALGGAGFLLVVLLNQPPWPTIFPPAPAVVGHALLVDKNFIELVALLVLASTTVGRWGGLDHFVYRYIGEPLLNRKNKKDKPAGGSDESDS